MKTVRETIEKYNLIKEGDIIGVGVSGGSDSMSLLHFLCELKKEKRFDIVVINIDHSIRENSKFDSEFVMNYAEENKIRAYTFNVDVPKLCQEANISIETGAREARYKIFSSLLEKKIVSKIATAHHLSDQAETVLFHIFRGCGISGAKGIEIQRDQFIRPMLETSEEEVLKYIKQNEIPFVEDETNKENSYDRNYIRNLIIPKIKERWPNFAENISNFAKCCREDDEYIKSQIITDNFLVDGKTVRIPLSSFLFAKSLVVRIIFNSLHEIGVKKNIESKHIASILELASTGKNGAKISLPMKISVFKEYDYITISNLQKQKKVGSWLFKPGSFQIENFGKITTKSVPHLENDSCLYVDAQKIPKGAKWRFRREGDTITKFGGGTKKLQTYLIEKKVPQRLRDDIPVLALLNEVFVVASVGINDNVRVDENTKKIYQISVK